VNDPDKMIVIVTSYSLKKKQLAVKCNLQVKELFIFLFIYYVIVHKKAEQ